jgi:hypothetical protein
MTKDKIDGMTGRDLQESQSGGNSGRFGGNQDGMQRSGQAGGGTEAADVSGAGGSSGTGGYGSSQDVVNQQDQQARGGADSGQAGGDRPQARGAGVSRGERYDEEANGGRGADEVSPSAEELEFAEDQAEHQDRGQSEADEAFNRDSD